MFHPSNAYTEGGHLVLKMEPEHTRHEEHDIEMRVRESFEMDLDHRRQKTLHGRKYLGPNEAYDNSDWSDDEEHVEHRDHHELDYVQHHDDLYRTKKGEFVVDHHDTYGREHKDDDYRLVEPEYRHHYHGHEDYEHEGYEHHYHQPELHHTEHYYDRPESYDHHHHHHDSEHEKKLVHHQREAEREWSDAEDLHTDEEVETDSEAELEEYRRHIAKH